MAMVEVEALKATHRATWAAGDYAAVAELIDEIPPAHVLREVPVDTDLSVLDVATGTGNVALRAAAAGAAVVGLDLTPELFEAARSRSDALGVDVEWVTGDAEALPYESETFDRVYSVFGVQFAPRHAVAAAELARVCKPGGSIGLVNWTPQSPVGEMFAIMRDYLPAAPPYASPPPLWGDEEHVRELFAGTGVELRFTWGSTPFQFDSGEHFMSFFETNYGPMVKARERLTAEGTWEACRDQIVQMMEWHNVGGAGRLDVPSEYVVVVGEKTVGAAGA
jgi:SAM-dependent methyltransferase